MNKNTAWFFGLLLLFSLLLSACSPAATPSKSFVTSPNSAGAPINAPKAADGTGQKAVAPAPASEQSVAEATKRLVIRNATLSVIVKDPGSSMSAISKMAEDMGGYVVTSNLSKYTTSDGAELPQAQITARVPAETLNEAMDAIKAMVQNKGTDILSENVTGQDVTKEYTDQTSRLTNLQNAEKQLQKILDETTKTDEVLTVYNQLVAIREQIEVTKGQIKYYEESSALSSITVSLSVQSTVRPLSIGGWQPVGVARDALQATISTLQFLGSVAIWLVLFFTPIGFVCFLFFLVLRFIFRKLFPPRTKKIQPLPPQGPQTPPSGPQPPLTPSSATQQPQAPQPHQGPPTAPKP